MSGHGMITRCMFFSLAAFMVVVVVVVVVYSIWRPARRHTRESSGVFHVL